nr:hypothetical protein CFP56_01222 [Quercus suber]
MLLIRHGNGASPIISTSGVDGDAVSAKRLASNIDSTFLSPDSHVPVLGLSDVSTNALSLLLTNNAMRQTANLLCPSLWTST